MRRYEPKPWDIRRCDMIHADEGEYVLYCDAQTEIERLTKERDEATIKAECWETTARKMEDYRDDALAQVAAAYEAAASIVVTGEPEISPITRHAITALTTAHAQAALEAYGREKVQEGMQRAASAAIRSMTTALPGDDLRSGSREGARMKRAPDNDTLAEIRAIRLAQRERGWKLIALDVEAFEMAEAEAKREARS